MFGYKPLPPPEVLAIHGELSLEPGWYIEGDPRVLRPSDRFLFVNDDSAVYLIWRGSYWQTHREDGPAVIHKSGLVEWYIDGKLVDPL